MKKYLIILLPLFFNVALSTNLDPNVEAAEIQAFMFLIATRSRSFCNAKKILFKDLDDPSAKTKNIATRLLEKFGSYYRDLEIEGAEFKEKPFLDDYFDTKTNVIDAFKELEEEELIDTVKFCFDLIKETFDYKKEILESLSGLPRTEIYKLSNSEKEFLKEIPIILPIILGNRELIDFMVLTAQQTFIMPHCIALFVVEEFLKREASSEIKMISSDVKIKDVQDCQEFFKIMLQKYYEASRAFKQFNQKMVTDVLNAGEFTVFNFLAEDFSS